MKGTIKLISEMTGFSPATVSNALNHKRGVNKQTVERVLQVAEEIGYSVKPRISKIKFVIYKKNGLISNDSPFFPAVIEGVERQAKNLQFETMFCNIDSSSPDCAEQLHSILEDTSAAVILLGTEMTEQDFQLFRNPKCHLILLDGWSDTITFDSVLISNTDSACHAVEYLIEKGHKKIGYLRGRFRIKAFSYRSIGYKRALGKANFPIEPQHIITLGTTTESAYRDMVAHLEGSRDLPTAFFADNDVIALGAMRALQEKGYRVPEDVSIIGFDNMDLSRITHPRLTIVTQPLEQIGTQAAKLLLEHLTGSTPCAPVSISLSTTLQEGASVRRL